MSRFAFLGLVLALLAVACRQDSEEQKARLVWDSCVVKKPGCLQPPEVVSATFRWRNESTVPVRVGRIQTKCGCLALSWTAESSGVADLRAVGAYADIQPGESGTFTVRFVSADSRRMERVTVHGQAWIQDGEGVPWQLVVEYETDNRFVLRRAYGSGDVNQPTAWAVSAATLEPFGIEGVRAIGVSIGAVDRNKESTEWLLGGYAISDSKRVISIIVRTSLGGRRQLHYEYK